MRLMFYYPFLLSMTSLNKKIVDVLFFMNDVPFMMSNACLISVYLLAD